MSTVLCATITTQQVAVKPRQGCLSHEAEPPPKSELPDPFGTSSAGQDRPFSWRSCDRPSRLDESTAGARHRYVYPTSEYRLFSDWYITTL